MVVGDIERCHASNVHIPYIMFSPYNLFVSRAAPVHPLVSSCPQAPTYPSIIPRVPRRTHPTYSSCHRALKKCTFRAPNVHIPYILFSRYNLFCLTHRSRTTPNPCVIMSSSPTCHHAPHTVYSSCHRVCAKDVLLAAPLWTSVPFFCIPVASTHRTPKSFGHPEREPYRLFRGCLQSRFVALHRLPKK